MFESEVQTRAAICGTGLLLALIFLFAHLPLILLIVPVAILFLGLIAVIPLIFTKFSDLSRADLIISGSGLIIVVGVVMELIRQVNAQLLAHDYEKLV